MIASSSGPGRAQRSLCSPDHWICLLFVGLTIGWSIYAGKDLNWDQLNYHFYVAYSLITDRLGHDFMAASGQSYLNPLVYVPFYWMVIQEWHSVAVASVLAAFHSLNIVVVYALIRTALPEPTRHNRWIGTLGALLAFLSPIFLMEAGTTFADITTSVFLLGALLFLLRSDPAHSWWKNGALFAGIMAGAAVGLKLSNLVFGPALGITILLLYPTLRDALRGIVLLGLGAFIGVVLTHGYWSWQLLSTYGDPSSPTLGSLLTSSDIPRSTATFPQRFAPETFIEALTFPFRMMDLRGWIYVETPAPDLRFAVAALLFITASVLAIRKSERVRALVANKRMLALLGFFVMATITWIATSANGRYGIPVSILCGGVLAVTAHVMSERKAIVCVALGALAVLQVVHLQNGQVRWTSERWTSSWYEVSMPERLKVEPYLYISIGGNSNAYIVPSLARDSSFTNPIGQYSVDFEGPGGARLSELLRRYRGRIRIISQAEPADSPTRFEAWIRSADTIVARLGFTVDSSDCLMITTAGPHWHLGRDARSRQASAPSTNALRTCRLKERRYAHAKERARMTRIAQEITEWCPKLFRSPHVVLEQIPEGWYASYVSTDTTLLITDKIVLHQPRTAGDVFLGTVRDWEENRRPECASIPERFRKSFGFE